MNRAIIVFALLSLLYGLPSSAQNTMMAGKIADENGMPLKGAIIQVLKGGEVMETRSDDDGLFYTQILPAGYYRIGIEANGTYYKTKKMWILPAEEKKFYYFSIIGKRVYVTVDGDDPFLRSTLTKIESSDPRIYSIDGGRLLFLDHMRTTADFYQDQYQEHFLIRIKDTTARVSDKR